MTKTTDMTDSFVLNARRIDEILAKNDAFAAERLFQAYRASADQGAFTVALIGRLLVAELKAK